MRSRQAGCRTTAVVALRMAKQRLVDLLQHAQQSVDPRRAEVFCPHRALR